MDILELTSRSLEPNFKDLRQICGLGNPLGALPFQKAYHMLNFNNFSTTSPILELDEPLDSPHQGFKLCLWGKI